MTRRRAAPPGRRILLISVGFLQDGGGISDYLEGARPAFPEGAWVRASSRRPVVKTSAEETSQCAYS